MEADIQLHFENMGEKIEGISTSQKETTKKLSEIHTTLTKTISYNDGLNMDNRLKTVEKVMNKKASWSALRWGFGAIVALIAGVSSIFAVFK